MHSRPELPSLTLPLSPGKQGIVCRTCGGSVPLSCNYYATIMQ